MTVATVLTVYGIETLNFLLLLNHADKDVATVLTVYGIETSTNNPGNIFISWLQQYLPFTVLKHRALVITVRTFEVATVLTVYGIETITPKEIKEHLDQ